MIPRSVWATLRRYLRQREAEYRAVAAALRRDGKHAPAGACELGAKDCALTLAKMTEILSRRRQQPMRARKAR